MMLICSIMITFAILFSAYMICDTIKNKNENKR